jgi:hypothetical protein
MVAELLGVLGKVYSGRTMELKEGIVAVNPRFCSTAFRSPAILQVIRLVSVPKIRRTLKRPRRKDGAYDATEYRTCGYIPELTRSRVKKINEQYCEQRPESASDQCCANLSPTRHELLYKRRSRATPNADGRNRIDSFLISCSPQAESLPLICRTSAWSAGSSDDKDS